MQRPGRSIAALSMALSAALLAGCASMGGAPESPVLAQLGRQTDLLMVGEIHGTQETPAAFADLVEAAARRQPIAVGLEIPDSAIAEARCGQAGPQAGGAWFRSAQDGRTSRAMRELVCRLRPLVERGRVSLFGFVPGGRAPPGRHHYADAIQSRVRQSSRPAMLLIGNYHARRVPNGLVQALEAGGLRTVAVTVSAPEGTAFVCDRAGKCGAKETAARFCEVTSPTPVLLAGPAARIPAGLPWDGCLVLSMITASPPIAAGP